MAPYSPSSSSSPRTSSWLVPSLLVGLTALTTGCVVRTQPQPVYYANDPAYAQPAPPPPPYGQPAYGQPAAPPPAYGQPAYAEPAPAYVATPPVAVDATVYTSEPPPPPVVEYRPPSPGYGYLWVDGFWDWNGYDWAWSNGYWQPNRPDDTPLSGNRRTPRDRCRRGPCSGGTGRCRDLYLPVRPRRRRRAGGRSVCGVSGGGD